MRSGRGRLRHLWQEGWLKGRLFDCDVNMQPPLAVGPVLHVGMPRRPFACSIPSLLAAARANGLPLLAGETHATLAQTCAILPQHVQ